MNKQYDVNVQKKGSNFLVMYLSAKGWKWLLKNYGRLIFVIFPKGSDEFFRKMKRDKISYYLH